MCDLNISLIDILLGISRKIGRFDVVFFVRATLERVNTRQPVFSQRRKEPSVEPYPADKPRVKSQSDGAGSYGIDVIAAKLDAARLERWI